MKCAIYARVSTKDKGQDVRNQLEQLRAYCDKQGWQITGEYIDERSGKNGDRVEFQRMMNNAYQREFDVVLFWSLDRFSREGVFETLQYLRHLSSYGVAFKSFTEAYLDGTGIFKDAIIGILAALARQERVRLSERVTAGLERARKEGRIGGRPRKNYKQDKGAQRIRQLREEGQSIRSIADELGYAKSHVQRVCAILGCAPTTQTPSMMV